MKDLERMRPKLKILSRPDHRAAVATLSAVVATLLIAGGIAFAAQEAQNDTSALGPDRKVASKKSSSSSSTDDKSSNGGQKPALNNSAVTTTTLPPTTVVLPNGETITVPAPITQPDDGLTGIPSPGPTIVPTPTTQTPPPPTIPAETTTTTRPIPNQEQPQLDVSVSGGSNPEDPVVTIIINVSDSDGFITTIDVTWDAGEAPVNYASYPGSACDDPPPSSRSINASWQYAVPGTHSVSVTVTTISCDGSSQQASRSVSVNSGGTTDTTTDLSMDPEEPQP